MKITPEYAEITFNVSLNRKEQDFVKELQTIVHTIGISHLAILSEEQRNELRALLFGLRKGIDGLSYDSGKQLT